MRELELLEWKWSWWRLRWIPIARHRSSTLDTVAAIFKRYYG